MQPAYAIQLSPSTSAAVLASDIMARAKTVLGPDNAILNESSNTLTIRCHRRTAQLIQHELSSPHPWLERVEAHFLCHMCESSAEGIMLSLCEHVVCFNCFRKRTWHILASPMEKHFPIRCTREGCGEQIPLSDLRKLVPAQRLHALFDAATDEHVLVFADKYQFCRTRGCNTVRLKSEVPVIFTCSACLEQTCAFKKCGREPHIGWDCRSNLVSSHIFIYN